MSPIALTPTTIVVRRDGFMEAEIDQEVVAMNVENGFCYGLNPVGTRIWQMLANPSCAADICKTLVGEYEVDPETCEREVLGLLEQFQAEGMITVPAETNKAAAKGQT